MRKVQNKQLIEREPISVSSVNNVLAYIASHDNKVAFKYFESDKLLQMTYAEFYNLVLNVAAGFEKLGLTGKRVAVIGDTSPQWLATYLGALTNGTVIIPMDKELAVTEIEKFLSLVEADAIVYSKSFNEKLIKTITTHEHLKFFIPINAEYGDEISEKIVPFGKLVQMGQETVDNGYTVKPLQNPEEMCEMLFTSGTTGTSKCVTLCQKNIFSAVESALATVCFTKDDVVVSVLPVHHTYELMCLIAELALGVEICINDSLRHVMKNFALFKPTALVLVPLFMNTMHKKIWHEAEKTGKDKILKAGIKLSQGLRKVKVDMRSKLFKSVTEAFGGRLDHIICGGAKLNPDLIYEFEEFGITVCEGFGITECSPLVAVDRYYNRKPGSIGPAVPSCQVRIDPNGETTPDGYAMGEIQVKGDNVMLGYYNNPDANADVFTSDGWFRTGDVGYLDNEGYIYITGRIKFVIVLENGKNVFPEEIEEYLEGIETIAESCVIGRKATDSDTVNLVAVVYPDFSKFPKGACDDEIKDSIRKSINAVNKKLPSFKQIKAVEIRKTEFEKTTTKKIKRQLVK